MINREKFRKLNTILIALLIAPYFLVMFISLFLKDIPVIFSFIDDYINSGNSIFFPFLPYIDIFEFLPVKYQIIRFSVGHLIDIIIFNNLIPYLEAGCYHYIKWVCSNEENQLFHIIDSHFLKSKENRASPSQFPSLIIGLKAESKHTVDNLLFRDKFETNYCQYDGNANSYSPLRRNKQSNNVIQNRGSRIKFEIALSNNSSSLQVSDDLSFSNLIWIFPLKDHCHYPNVNKFTTFNNYIQRGEEG